MKKMKLFLIFVIGLLFGLIMHGVTEIVAIWVLLNWLSEFFFKVSWSTWYLIHIVSMMFIEVFGLIIVLLIYTKYEK